MVLDDVADDAVLVKVPAPALRAEGLLEDDLHVRDVVPVPQRRQKAVREPHHHQVLRQLLAKVVVDAVQLRLGEQRGDAAAERLGGFQVPAEGLLHDHARPAAGGHARLADVRAHGRVHGGGKRQVEDAVAGDGVALALEPRHPTAQPPEHVRPARVFVRAALVEAPREERLDFLGRALQAFAERLAQTRVVQVRARVPHHHGALGHVVVQEQREERGVGFLLRQVAGAPEHRDRQARPRVAPVRLVRVERGAGLHHRGRRSTQTEPERDPRESPTARLEVRQGHIVNSSWSSDIRR